MGRMSLLTNLIVDMLGHYYAKRVIVFGSSMICLAYIPVSAAAVHCWQFCLVHSKIPVIQYRYTHFSTSLLTTLRIFMHSFLEYHQHCAWYIPLSFILCSSLPVMICTHFHFYPTQGTRKLFGTAQILQKIQHFD